MPRNIKPKTPAVRHVTLYPYYVTFSIGSVHLPKGFEQEIIVYVETAEQAKRVGQARLKKANIPADRASMSVVLKPLYVDEASYVVRYEKRKESGVLTSTRDVVVHASRLLEVRDMVTSPPHDNLTSNFMVAYPVQKLVPARKIRILTKSGELVYLSKQGRDYFVADDNDDSREPVAKVDSDGLLQFNYENLDAGIARVKRVAENERTYSGPLNWEISFNGDRVVRKATVLGFRVILAELPKGGCRWAVSSRFSLSATNGTARDRAEALHKICRTVGRETMKCLSPLGKDEWQS